MPGEVGPDNHDGSEQRASSRLGNDSPESQRLFAEAMQDALWEAASPEERERITKVRAERAARAEGAEPKNDNEPAPDPSQPTEEQARMRTAALETITNIDEPHNGHPEADTKADEGEPENLPMGRDAKIFLHMLEGNPGGAGVYDRDPETTEEMIEQLKSNGLIGEDPVVTIRDTYALRRRTGIWKTLHNLKEWELSQSIPTPKSIAEISIYGVTGHSDAALAVIRENKGKGKYEITGWSTLLTEKKKSKKAGEDPGHEDAFVYDRIRRQTLPSNALRTALADSHIIDAAVSNRIKTEPASQDMYVPHSGPEMTPQETSGWGIAAREEMVARMTRMEQAQPSKSEDAGAHEGHGGHDEHESHDEPVPEVSPAQVAAAEAAAQANEAAARAAAEKMSRQQAEAAKELIKLEKHNDLRATQLLDYSDVLTGDELKASQERFQNDPNSLQHKEALKRAFRAVGENEILRIAGVIREQALAEMQSLNIEPTKSGESISWAIWDLIEQRNYALNPEAASDEYRDNLADPFRDDDSGRQKRQEIVDHNVGWELDTAIQEGRADKTKLSQSNPAAVEVHDKGERNDANELRSLEYVRLGRSVRESREAREEEAKVKAEEEAKAKAEEAAKAKGKKKDKDKDKDKKKGKDKKDKVEAEQVPTGTVVDEERLSAPVDPASAKESQNDALNAEAKKPHAQEQAGADLLGSKEYSVSGSAKFSELVQSVQEADREAGVTEDNKFGVAPAGHLSFAKVQRLLEGATSKADIKAIERELIARDEQNHRDQGEPLRFERKTRSNGEEYLVGANGTSRKIIREIAERRRGIRDEREKILRAKTASRNEQERNRLVDLTDDWNQGRENQRNAQMQTGLGGNDIETAESDGEREAFIARQRILSQQGIESAAARPEPASYSERDTDDETTGFSTAVNRMRQADPTFDVPKSGALSDEQVGELLGRAQTSTEVEWIEQELSSARNMPITEAMNARYDELAASEVAAGNYGDEARNDVAKRFEEMAESEADRSDWGELIDEAVNLGLAQRSESARLGIEAEEGSIQSEAFVAKMNELYPEGAPENNVEASPETESDNDAEREKQEADLAGNLLDRIRNVNLRERDETRRENRLASIYAEAVRLGLAAADNSAVPYGISAPKTPTVGSIIFWAGFEQSQQRSS